MSGPSREDVDQLAVIERQVWGRAQQPGATSLWKAFGFEIRETLREWSILYSARKDEV